MPGTRTKQQAMTEATPKAMLRMSRMCRTHPGEKNRNESGHGEHGHGGHGHVQLGSHLQHAQGVQGVQGVQSVHGHAMSSTESVARGTPVSNHMR